MSLLFNQDFILDIDPNSIIEASIGISKSYDNTLHVWFAGRRRTPDTNVYRVAAFKYCAKLLDNEAEYREYAGPKYVIRNDTSKCVKGVGEPRSSFITAQCAEPYFIDNRLSFWKVIERSKASGGDTASQTEVQEAWPSVLVYCYPSNITIGSNNVERCPPYVFALNATWAWSIPSYVSSPAAIEVLTSDRMRPMIADVEHIHLRDNNASIRKLDAIDRVRELGLSLNVAREGNTLLEATQFRISYKHAFFFCMIVSGVIILIYLRSAYKSIQVINQLREDAKRRRDRGQPIYDLPRRRSQSAMAVV